MSPTISDAVRHSRGCCEGTWQADQSYIFYLIGNKHFEENLCTTESQRKKVGGGLWVGLHLKVCCGRALSLFKHWLTLSLQVSKASICQNIRIQKVKFMVNTRGLFLNGHLINQAYGFTECSVKGAETPSSGSDIMHSFGKH